ATVVKESLSPDLTDRNIKFKTYETDKINYLVDKDSTDYTEYDKIITQIQNEFTEKQLKHKKILEQLTIASQKLDNSRAQLEENQINIATLKAMIDIRRGLSVPQLKAKFIQIYGDGT